MTKPTDGAVLKEIPLSDVVDHPDNPRLGYRQDVIDGIAANLNGSPYPAKHAIHVRPRDGKYETLAGHHRRRAAEKAGHTTIQAWVEELDDDAAFMELALSNNQGELDPLEVGFHALRVIPTAKGGRGKKGGLSEYAKKLGKDQGDVSRYRQAAEVLRSLGKPMDCSIGFLGKTQHLAAIHGADDDLWPMLVDNLASRGWSADETRDIAKKAKGFRDVCPRQQRWAGWLLIDRCLQRYIDTREFAPATVEKLVAQAKATVAMIQTYDVAHDEHIAAFTDWLVVNQGGSSWDLRKLKQRHQEIDKALSEAHSTQWLHGRWQDYVGEMKDESVALLLTDPPYGVDYQSDFRLDRSKPRKHERIEGDGEADAVDGLRECLEAMLPRLQKDAHVLCFCHWSNEAAIRAAVEAAGYKVRGSLVWVKNNTGMGDPNTTFAPKHERIIHAVKGSPTIFERQADVLEYARCNSDRHPTEKPVPLLSRLIEVTTVKGELVADPFGGVASTIAAAKQLGRAGWGCEVDEEYWRRGADRLEEGNG